VVLADILTTGLQEIQQVMKPLLFLDLQLELGRVLLPMPTVVLLLKTLLLPNQRLLSLTSVSQTNVSCNGGTDGAASVSLATGGTAGYTYNWEPGTPTGDGTPTITGLTAGTWTCTVTDANSCTATETFIITEPITPNVTPTFTQVPPICSGVTLQELPLTSSNGINGSWSPALDTTATTTYTFTPTAGQCATIATMTISVAPVVTTPSGSTDQTFCNGETVGDLVVTGSSIVWYDAATLGNIVDTTTALIAGTTYYASQTISSCESAIRLAVMVSNGACLSNDSFEDLSVLVYPNPTKNVLNISCKEGISTVVFYNLLGMEVVKKVVDATATLIDTSNLSSGTYFVVISSNDKVKRVKIIKE